MRKTVPTIDRLLSKVNKTDTCWIWTAHKDRKGYGRLMVRDGDRYVPRLAHRLVYEHLCGPIPDSLFVCHSCDTPACVNPEHLWLGTNRDNAYDMIKKGRWKQPPAPLKGRDNRNSKLTEDALLDIRSAPARTAALAKKYGVSIGTIKNARRGSTYNEDRDCRVAEPKTGDRK